MRNIKYYDEVALNRRYAALKKYSLMLVTSLMITLYIMTTESLPSAWSDNDILPHSPWLIPLMVTLLRLQVKGRMRSAFVGVTGFSSPVIASFRVTLITLNAFFPALAILIGGLVFSPLGADFIMAKNANTPYFPYVIIGGLLATLAWNAIIDDEAPYQLLALSSLFKRPVTSYDNAVGKAISSHEAGHVLLLSHPVLRDLFKEIRVNKSSTRNVYISGFVSHHYSMLNMGTLLQTRHGMYWRMLSALAGATSEPHSRSFFPAHWFYDGVSGDMLNWQANAMSYLLLSPDNPVVIVPDEATMNNMPWFSHELRYRKHAPGIVQASAEFYQKELRALWERQREELDAFFKLNAEPLDAIGEELYRKGSLTIEELTPHFDKVVWPDYWSFVDELNFVK
ncbi:MAG: hypothetical protein GY774_23560 [Planctomycetes bacterium]|nr:hypothetical protein [Planctomycetota bacterium]